MTPAEALAALRAAEARDGAPSLKQRRTLLAGLARAVMARSHEIMAVLDAEYEGRAPIETLLADVLLVADAARYARRNLWHWMRARRVSVPYPFWPARAREEFVPKGVVGIMAPWNYPVQLALLPAIDAIARTGNAQAIDFPRGLTTPKDMAKHRFDVSFSGLKTAVARWIETEQLAGNSIMVNDVAASFQEAIVDVLLRKAIDACLSNDVGTLVIGGGVAANSRLRTEAAQRCQEHNIALRIPRPGLCTDNGAMVAALGSELVKRGRDASQLSFATDSSMNITNVVA
jgi:hypothetical protein